ADLDGAGVHVAQHHVGFAKTGKIAETHELPFLADRAQEGRIGDEVVADVVNLETAGTAVAQDHVAGIAAGEPAEADELPIGPDGAQLISGEQRVTADVVNLILAIGAVPQDHVGGRAAGRRWVRRDGEEKAVKAASEVIPDDLAGVVDAVCVGLAVDRGDVEIREPPAAVEEAVLAVVILIDADDLA